MFDRLGIYLLHQLIYTSIDVLHDLYLGYLLTLGTNTRQVVAATPNIIKADMTTKLASIWLARN